MWYGLQDSVSELFGMSAPQHLRKDEFWAVSDVSFELRRGQCLGLIGGNGAGKSTLLKMLNGIIKPDRGEIEMRGRVGALIELGTGFNGILTGRENVYNNGVILGLSKKEIDELFDEIVEFAELQEFIDAPLKNYSSGMRLRLGFAVAAHMKPDILILDEVLAVGDAAFKMKSMSKMYELISSCAVIFVNHSANNLSRVATDILYLEKGENKYYGSDVSRGIETYQQNVRNDLKTIIKDAYGHLLNLQVSSSDETIGHDGLMYMAHLSDLIIFLQFTFTRKVSKYKLVFSFTNKDLIIVGQFHSDYFECSNSEEIQKMKVIIPAVLFVQGHYFVSLEVVGILAEEDTPETVLINYKNCGQFYVISHDSSALGLLQLTGTVALL